MLPTSNSIHIMCIGEITLILYQTYSLKNYFDLVYSILMLVWIRWFQDFIHFLFCRTKVNCCNLRFLIGCPLEKATIAFARRLKVGVMSDIEVIKFFIQNSWKWKICHNHLKFNSNIRKLKTKIIGSVVYTPSHSPSSSHPWYRGFQFI